MKRRFIVAFAVYMLFCAAAQAESVDTVEMQDYVRLHVIANSDSDADQALKLLVRDEVLACSRELLGDTCSADDAFVVLAENIAVIEQRARTAAQNNGYFGEVCALTGTFDFPDREYGDLLVPAGEYRAVRVLLGDAVGQNWWCVIYPTLCAIDEHGEFVEEQAEIVFYSSIGRWLISTFGGTN